MVVCSHCGKEILYITAPGIDGKVYAVDTVERRLISRTGRVLTGYPEHKCPESMASKEGWAADRGKPRQIR
jgi:hypothetical protein